MRELASKQVPICVLIAALGAFAVSEASPGHSLLADDPLSNVSTVEVEVVVGGLLAGGDLKPLLATAGEADKLASEVSSRTCRELESLGISCKPIAPYSVDDIPTSEQQSSYLSIEIFGHRRAIPLAEGGEPAGVYLVEMKLSQLACERDYNASECMDDEVIFYRRALGSASDERVVAKLTEEVDVLIDDLTAKTRLRRLTAALTEVRLCQPKVPPTLQHGNATFPMIVELIVDVEGIPLDLRLRKSIPGVALPKDCIGSWRLRTVAPGEQVSAVFAWVHGVGWDSVEISAPSLRLLVKY